MFGSPEEAARAIEMIKTGEMRQKMLQSQESQLAAKVHGLERENAWLE